MAKMKLKNKLEKNKVKVLTTALIFVSSLFFAFSAFAVSILPTSGTTNPTLTSFACTDNADTIYVYYDNNLISGYVGCPSLGTINTQLQNYTATSAYHFVEVLNDNNCGGVDYPTDLACFIGDGVFVNETAYTIGSGTSPFVNVFSTGMMTPLKNNLENNIPLILKIAAGIISLAILFSTAIYFTLPTRADIEEMGLDEDDVKKNYFIRK